MARDEEFTQFVAARGASLRRTAFLMTGSWYDAEDLTQTALAKLYVAWPRVHVDGAESYARTILARSLVDARRRFWHRERPSVEVPDLPTVVEPVDDRMDLGRALALLPVAQRVVVVLRFWEDLTVEQVAVTLAVSPGTVKSRTSRALEALRGSMGADVASAIEEVSS